MGLDPAASAATGGRSTIGARRISRLAVRLSATVGLLGIHRAPFLQRPLARFAEDGLMMAPKQSGAALAENPEVARPPLSVANSDGGAAPCQHLRFLGQPFAASFSSKDVSTRAKRIHLRATDHQEGRIRTCAETRGLSVTDFLRDSASLQAEREMLSRNGR